MDIAVLGIDLGKNSCGVVGLDGSGKVILRRRMQRKTIVGLTSKLSPCIIAMEACCGAHHLGRVLSPQGRARLRVRITDLLRQGTEALSSRICLLIEDMLTRDGRRSMRESPRSTANLRTRQSGMRLRAG
jgi:hypothetical protein